jgi:hypothetical protein
MMKPEPCVPLSLLFTKTASEAAPWKSDQIGRMNHVKKRYILERCFFSKISAYFALIELMMNRTIDIGLNV